MRCCKESLIRGGQESCRGGHQDALSILSHARWGRGFENTKRSTIMRVQKKRLTYDLQQSALSALLPLVEGSWQLLDAMVKKGWSRVLPRLRFDESFGTGDEISEHRQIVIEEQKFRVATPNIRYHVGGAPFVSPFLRELQLGRSQQLGHSFDAQTEPRWKRYPDICARRKERLAYEHPAEFNARFRGVEAKEQECIEAEVSSLRDHCAYPFHGEEASPDRCYLELLTRYATPLGFQFDQLRSGESGAVFSKLLFDKWRLCLSPEPLVWYAGRSEGEIRLVLSVQAGPLRHPLRAGPFTDFLVVEYAEFIRYFEFLHRRFRTVDELEANVAASLALLELVLNPIEASLIGPFQGL